MEIRLLKTFVSVAIHKNFSAAARELNTVQPAVSRQISDLEYELDTPLFTRTTRDVKLTAAGEMLLPEAQAILAQEKQARDIVHRAAAGKTGNLRVGYIGPACLQFLPILVQRYSDQFPDVQLTLEDLTARQQIDAFASDKIDIGFSRSLPETIRGNFSCRTIYSDNLSVFISDTDPLSEKAVLRLKELKRHAFIMFERNGAEHLFDQSIAACQHAGFSPRIERQVASMQSVLTHVASGLGVTLAPNCIRHLNVSGCRRVPIKDKIKKMTFEVQYPHSNDNPTIGSFISVVENALPDIQAQMELSG